MYLALDEFQNTGENWKRWLKRYSYKRPQLAG
jgi:hypothetical protein